VSAKQAHGTGSLDAMDGIRWGEQALSDALGWQLANGHAAPGSTQEAAFRAGFQDGWRQALSTLKLHGVIATFDRPASDWEWRRCDIPACNCGDKHRHWIGNGEAPKALPGTLT